MARKSDVLANPFHLALLGLGGLFLLTSLAYLASGSVLEPARAETAGASREAALWLDRHGPGLLAVELILMLPAAALLVAFDRRNGRPRRPRRPRR
ncbi:MAG: hypothetical protein BGO49_08415 [Planctomycetales bacterium 71-10]|nr:MAG: hypothetical protein BGO49_08415 [Planctomycetales bacterium 71-10]